MPSSLFQHHHINLIPRIGKQQGTDDVTANHCVPSSSAVVPPSVPSGSSVSLEDASNDSYSCKIPSGESRPPITETITSYNSITFSTLWDLGATESYIDYQAAAPSADQWQPYLQPITLRLFHGQTLLAGPILRYLDLELLFVPNTSPKLVQLSLTKLEGSDIMLRAAWMSSNQVTIDWSHSNIVLPCSCPSPSPSPGKN